jgi:hypothetical protein
MKSSWGRNTARLPRAFSIARVAPLRIEGLAPLGHRTLPNDCPKLNYVNHQRRRHIRLMEHAPTLLH